MTKVDENLLGTFERKIIYLDGNNPILKLNQTQLVFVYWIRINSLKSEIKKGENEKDDRKMGEPGS